jgi:uncharacterized protein GlcG (DUF336 family)
MIRSCALAATVAILVAGINPSAAQDLPTEAHKLLPAALAVKAGQTAIAICKGQSYNVLVAVAERSGLPQLLIVGDGAGALSREVARRKAYTASQLGASTADFAKRVAGGGFNSAVFDTQPVAAVGGLPVKVGEETIPSIGSVVLPAATRTKPAPRQVWPRSLTG